MFLIYISQKDNSDEESPECDLQPVMAVISGKKHEKLILRDAETKDIQVPKPKNHKDAERIFVKLKQKDDHSETQDEDEDENVESDNPPKSQPDENTPTRMAVALATIFFPSNKVSPFKVDYVDHIVQRSRIADALVIAGYTDEDCTLKKAEDLALRRALSVKRTLKSYLKKDMKIYCVARPKTCFDPNPKRSRRVEVLALFNGPSANEQPEMVQALNHISSRAN